MPTIELKANEERALRNLVSAVEEMMLDLTPEAVGKIADYVGEYGTAGDGGIREDAAVVECLRVIVDEMAR